MKSKLTLNISRNEVRCNCGCRFDTLDIKTAEIVQECCDHIADSLDIPKVILHINSGCRCLAWNDHEGGGLHSQHLYGRALDFWIEDIDPGLVYEYLNHKYPYSYGIGNYKDFTHFDTRSEDPARLSSPNSKWKSIASN